MKFPSRSRWFPLPLLFLMALFDASLASKGDRSPAYHRCLDTCHIHYCNPPSALPLDLRLTFWTCADDCKYRCQQVLTDMLERGEALQDLTPGEVVQFHGKWPFVRLLGMQEPASVLFSLFNLLAHARYTKPVFQMLPSNLPPPLKWGYRGYNVVSLNLWVWSMVFHSRDKSWTEKMDYFSAALATILSLYVAFVRMGHLYTTSPRDCFLRGLLVLLLAATFTTHVSYLTLWRFDYGYNMAFNLSIALLHNVLWYGWSLTHFFAPIRPAHYYRPALVLTILSSLMALELFDFPPWKRLVDAHALWHLTTVLVIGAWYRFYLADAAYVAQQADEKKLKL